jgi:hypothetical protein
MFSWSGRHYDVEKPLGGWTTANTLSPAFAGFGIQVTMLRFLCTMILIGGSAQAQAAGQTTSTTSPDNVGPQPTAADGLSSPASPAGRVSLVRGVLRRFDPLHDELLVRAFGGGDVRIAFDPRTQLVAENTRTRFTSVPLGSVVSVDTVMDGGKLFALSVRAGSSAATELNGQVVRYDAAKSQLALRDPVSPESISLKITSSTMVVNRGQATSAQSLSPGMLVRAWFSAAQRAASKIEILAEPGNSFTFAGRIVAVDLRSHVLALSNDSDQSVRELAIDSLDPISLGLLRQDANVTIQAEFDGARYQVRTVTRAALGP